jgi:hypothetical protein
MGTPVAADEHDAFWLGTGKAMTKSVTSAAETPQSLGRTRSEPWDGFFLAWKVHVACRGPNGKTMKMADFNLIINENHDVDIVASSEDTNLDGLLSDEVVMQWLMDLEAEDLAADLADGGKAEAAKQLHA